MKYIIKLFLYLILPNWAAGQVLTGLVLDDKKLPVASVTVSWQGTDVKTRSDEEGRFSIPLSVGYKMLRISAVGFETAMIDVTGKEFVEVTLKPGLNTLDEIQIIGYGTTTQRLNVGSVTKITAEEIGRQPVANPLLALQGQVPGLVVSATSGLPSSSVRIQIRGQNTLSPDAFGLRPQDQPLFVVDGVPFGPQNVNVNQFNSIVSPGDGAYFNNAYGGMSPFNSIPPENIESIEILRDADATSIYGSRGGNGVILITTKRGIGGRTSIDADFRQGISMAAATMPMMGTATYLRMRREAFENDGVSPTTTPYATSFAPDLLVFDQSKMTDWKEMFLGNTAQRTDAGLTLQGGSDLTTFRIHANFNRETYLLPGNFADRRANVMANMQHRTSDNRVSVVFSAQYTHSDNRASGNADLLRAFTRVPNYPDPISQDGSLVWSYEGVDFLDASLVNPEAYLREQYEMGSRLLNSSISLVYRPVKGLSLRGDMGYSIFNTDEYKSRPIASLNPLTNTVATANYGNSEIGSWIAEPQLNYAVQIGKGRLQLLAGATLQRTVNKSVSVSASGYLNDGLISTIAGAAESDAMDSFSDYRYAALFGRANYVWDDKYIVNVNLRRDGSSRFGPNRRFGTFGSIGAGWIFSAEKWAERLHPVLSYGKLRGSYGVTGSDATAPYQYISRWAPSLMAYNGQIGFMPQNLMNSLLGWASTRKLETGLELGFFSDKVVFSGAWYRNRTGDQLINYTLPFQTGFNSVATNWEAVVENSGIELVLTSTVLKNNRLQWKTSLNASFPKNRLVSFPQIESSSYATTYLVGQSVNTVFGFDYAGVDPQTGLFQFRTSNGELTSSPRLPQGAAFNDYVRIGSPDPVFFGGFSNTFDYGRLSFGFSFEFRKQMGMNYLSQVYAGVPGQLYNLPASFEDRWQRPGDVSAFQRVTTEYGDAYSAGTMFTRSNGVYGDASFLRLRNVNAGYSLNADWVSKLRIDRMRFELSAQNVWTITNYQGDDPETQNFYGVPLPMVFTAGIQISF